jgi:hypothetical protein
MQASGRIKCEYRNPKLETNSKYKCSNVQDRKAAGLKFLSFEFGSFGCCFELRASDFGFSASPQIVEKSPSELLKFEDLMNCSIDQPDIKGWTTTSTLPSRYLLLPLPEAVTRTGETLARGGYTSPIKGEGSYLAILHRKKGHSFTYKCLRECDP